MRASGCWVWARECRPISRRHFALIPTDGVTTSMANGRSVSTGVKIKAIEQWQNLVDSEKLALGLGVAASLCRCGWLCAD